MPLKLFDLQTLAYKPAWDRQIEIHTQVLEGQLAGGAIILVEHPPVITYGRRLDSQKNLLAPAKLLAAKNVELVETDRGGDITFHGPGQLVAYPIIPLNRYKLNLHTYMRLMEQVVIDTLAAWKIAGRRLEGATGVWIDPSPSADPKKCCDPATMNLAKICAMGIKVRKWVTFHGLALNVTTDLDYFNLINPCGLGRPVTSMQKILEKQTPAMQDVKMRLVEAFDALLANAARLTA
jgi:lipoate-protein ligase B